jgi:hypothetical protein
MIFFATDLHGFTRILEILPCSGKEKLQITKYKIQTNHKSQIPNYKESGALRADFKRLRQNHRMIGDW